MLKCDQPQALAGAHLLLKGPQTTLGGEAIICDNDDDDDDDDDDNDGLDFFLINCK